MRRLIELLREVVPYVEATLGPGCTYKTDNPAWIKVHAGRAASSVNQLRALLKEADAVERGKKE
jgi:hypothetical protein